MSPPPEMGGVKPGRQPRAALCRRVCRLFRKRSAACGQNQKTADSHALASADSRSGSGQIRRILSKRGNCCNHPGRRSGNGRRSGERSAYRMPLFQGNHGQHRCYVVSQHRIVNNLLHAESRNTSFSSSSVPVCYSAPDTSAVQPANASSPISVSSSGMETDASAVQPANASPPMCSRLSGNVTVASEPQL